MEQKNDPWQPLLTEKVPDTAKAKVSKRSPVGPGIMDNIHAPALSQAHRNRCRASVQRDMVSSPHPHPQLQAIKTESRRTRLRFTSQPSRRSKTQMRM